MDVNVVINNKYKNKLQASCVVSIVQILIERSLEERSLSLPLGSWRGAVVETLADRVPAFVFSPND